jgi:hypothetical protein
MALLDTAANGRAEGGGEVGMNFVNRICPKCNNPNYVVSLGNFSSAFKYKCMNCNSYLLEEDFLPVQKDDNNGWISVKDRLPDSAGVAVLVSATSQYGQQHVFEAFIGYGDFIWYTMDCTKMENRRITCNEVSNHWKITHWMPLPEPPKEEDNANQT